LLIAKREVCRAVFNDLGTLGALLVGIMHDASCSLRFGNAGLAAARMEVDLTEDLRGAGYTVTDGR
jgi:hypothetical protein